MTSKPLPVLVASIFIAAPIPEPLSAAEAPSNVPATLPHPAAQTMLTRQYQEGEIVFYRMAASNRDRFRTTTYRADATGTVKKEASGRFVEEFTWSNFVFDDKPLDLPAAKDFRQLLSRSPGYPMSVPDLRPVLKIVGPITDLLTFYADLVVATQRGALSREGDHFRFEYGTPASWADGSYVVLGEDSIDFDVTLKALTEADRVATLLVRHVVPTAPRIRIPVEWMRAPVADTPNNWVEVQKLPGGAIARKSAKKSSMRPSESAWLMEGFSARCWSTRWKSRNASVLMTLSRNAGNRYVRRSCARSRSVPNVDILRSVARRPLSARAPSHPLLDCRAPAKGPLSANISDRNGSTAAVERPLCATVAHVTRGTKYDVRSASINRSVRSTTKSSIRHAASEACDELPQLLP